MVVALVYSYMCKLYLILIESDAELNTFGGMMHQSMYVCMIDECPWQHFIAIVFLSFILSLILDTNDNKGLVLKIKFELNDLQLY